MRKALTIFGMLAALTLEVCTLAHAQVLNLNPTYLAQYYWNPATSSFLQCPNSSAAEAFPSTPQAVVPAGFNASLGQWTPSTTCNGVGPAVTTIIPGTGITCAPDIGGVCTGQITINAAPVGLFSCNPVTGGIACLLTGIARPVADATQFGAVGDGTTNDQAAAQAAYDALWGNGTGVQPYGGTVLFPAGHTYVIGDGVHPCTLNIHDSIGTLGASSGAGFGGYSEGAIDPPFLRWNCPVAGSTGTAASSSAGVGTTFTTSAVTGSLVAGQIAVGTNIPANDVITGISGTSPSFTVTLTTATTGAVSGTVFFTSALINVTSFVSAVNTTYFPPSSLCVVAPCQTIPPSTSTRAPPFARSLTFTQANTLAVGNWGLMTGCKGAGLAWNNKKMQVAFANTSSFVLTTNVGPTGTITDTCTLTMINVRMATDAYGNSEEQFDNIGLNDIPGAPAADVSILLQSRADARTHFLATWSDGARLADLDFEEGGINVELGHGWRSDGCSVPGGGNIYWSPLSQDRLYIGPGQFGSNCTYDSGAQLLIDNENPLSVNIPALSVVSDGAGWEQDTSIAQGSGQITVIPNTSTANPNAQVVLSIQGAGMVFGQGAAGAWGPSIMVNPPMDGAVQVNWLNGNNNSGTGNDQNVPIVGMGSAPANYGGGVMPLFVMGNSFASLSNAPTSKTSYPAIRAGGDIMQHSSGHFFQGGVLSSMFRYVDTAFAALPNGTSVVPGDLLAPPTSCWQAGGKRCALDYVITGGTVGTASGGNLTAVTTATADQYQLSSPSMAITSLTCSGSSLTITGPSNTFNTAGGDNVGVIGTAETFLNNGYWETTSATGTTAVVPFQCPAGFTGNPSDTGFVFISQTHDLQNLQTVLAAGAAQSAQIESINALNPMAVLLAMSRALGTVSSPAAFNFVAPVLGLEIQLPTKSAAAPATLAWSQGDMEQNSGATANGVAAWVNVAAGTPGTWAGIPLGDSLGHLSPSQAGIQVGTVTSASGTVTTAHTFATAFTATPNCQAMPYSNAGAFYFSTLPSTTSGGVITYATSGAQTFSEQCVGAGGVW